MADNYLEKHYEDYLKRKAEWVQARRKSVRHTHRTPPVKPDEEAQ